FSTIEVLDKYLSSKLKVLTFNCVYEFRVFGLSYFVVIGISLCLTDLLVEKRNITRTIYIVQFSIPCFQDNCFVKLNISFTCAAIIAFTNHVTIVVTYFTQFRRDFRRSLVLYDQLYSTCF